MEGGSLKSYSPHLLRFTVIPPSSFDYEDYLDTHTADSLPVAPWLLRVLWRRSFTRAWLVIEHQGPALPLLRFSCCCCCSPSTHCKTTETRKKLKVQEIQLILKVKSATNVYFTIWGYFWFLELNFKDHTSDFACFSSFNSTYFYLYSCKQFLKNHVVVFQKM